MRLRLAQVILLVWSLTVVMAGASENASAGERCPDPQPAPFADRADISEIHRQNVDCLFELGVVQGTLGEDGQRYFRPKSALARGQLAAMLHRILERTDTAEELPPPKRPRFPDVPAGHVFDNAIHVLAAAEIIAGRTDGTFAPGAAVQRDQMATLFLRMAEWATGLELEASGGPHFSDTADSVHRDNIDAAYEWELVQGRRAPSPGTPGVYEPFSRGSREQTATVAVRAWDAMDDLGDGSPPTAPPPEGCEPWQATPPPEGMDVRLELSAVSVAPGEPIDLELQVRNDGQAPVSHERGAQEYDFWVTDSEGVVVWLWSFDVGPWPDVLVIEEFEPGEQRIRSETWEQERCGETPPGSLSPGRYVAQGLWSTQEDTEDGARKAGWWSNPVEFEVEEAHGAAGEDEV